MPINIDPQAPPWSVGQACEVADLYRETAVADEVLLQLASRLERGPVRQPARTLAAHELRAAACACRKAARHLAQQAEDAAALVSECVEGLAPFAEGG